MYIFIFAGAPLWLLFYWGSLAASSIITFLFFCALLEHFLSYTGWFATPTHPVWFTLNFNLAGSWPVNGSARWSDSKLNSIIWTTRFTKVKLTVAFALGLKQSTVLVLVRIKENQTKSEQRELSKFPCYHKMCNVSDSPIITATFLFFSFCFFFASSEFTILFAYIKIQKNNIRNRKPTKKEKKKKSKVAGTLIVLPQRSLVSH